MAGPGQYGGFNLDAEQYGNAVAIAGVGNQMGASSRDVHIALMTAMTESGLRNLKHGDRDSQGLFQQRPSQGWGTVAQVTDPQYAARKFYEALFKVPARESLSLPMAAQRVQRSAFADGRNFAKYEALGGDLVRAITGGVLQAFDQRVGEIKEGFGGNPLTQISGALKGIAETSAAIGAIITKLALPSTWVRIFAGGFGIAFVFIGVMMLGREVRNGG